MVHDGILKTQYKTKFAKDNLDDILLLVPFSLAYVTFTRNNIKLVDVHMGFVLPTAPAHLREMLPSVAWPPVTEPGSNKVIASSRCDGNAKHTKWSCLNDKAGKHRKPAMTESLDSASSICSDMPPFLQPATSESGATVESGENMSHGCDNDPSKSTYKEPSTDSEQHAITPAVHDNTKTAATRSPDSTFSTTRCGDSKPPKRAEPCKTRNVTKTSTDQLPSGLPLTATAPTEPIAVNPPATTYHVAAGVHEHIDNPLAMSPDCSITKYTQGATPIAVGPVARTIVTAAEQHQGQPVTAVEDANWLDDLENHLSLDPIQSILQLLPSNLALTVQARLDGPSSSWHECILSDIVADQGRPVRLRYCSDSDYSTREEELAAELNISQAINALRVMHTTQQHAGNAPAEPFAVSSSMNVSGTLHRVSAMTNSCGEVYGLTYHIGQHLPGMSEPFIDIVSSVAKGGTPGTTGSLLLLGPPGVGKTTLLRDITCQLADKFNKLVIVVDTGGEIAGGGNVPHACIGSARRLLGSSQQSKYECLQEAVANHGPEVIVVDELSNAKEVDAVTDIAQRGVAVIAAAHGTTLQHLLENPVLNSLIGGKQKMEVKDSAAKSIDGRKIRLERCAAPVFSTMVEVVGHNQHVLHTDVAASVDAILAGTPPNLELRSSTSKSL